MIEHLRVISSASTSQGSGFASTSQGSGSAPIQSAQIVMPKILG